MLWEGCCSKGPGGGRVANMIWDVWTLTNGLRGVTAGPSMDVARAMWKT